MTLFHRMINCAVLISLLCPSNAGERGLRSSNNESILLQRKLQDDPCDGVDPTPLPAKIQAEDFCNSLGIQTEGTSDTGGGDNVGWIDGNDWMAFPIQVQTAGIYMVQYRVASPDGGGSLDLEWYGGVGVLGVISSLPRTGGWQNWETVSHEVELPAGSQTVAVKATSNGWNINWLEFSLLGETTSAPTQLPEPTTSPTSPPSHEPTPSPMSKCSSGATWVPAKIEAEDFCDSYGIQIEGTEDTGGGDNVGWIDGGDWMAYPITVPLNGEYTVDYRVASFSGGGSFDLEWYGGLGVLGTIPSLPSTGGWQNWITVSHKVELLAGTHTVAVKSLSGGWNLNWLEISTFEPSSPAPTLSPTAQPSSAPSAQPSTPQPTSIPTTAPSAQPSALQQTANPTAVPSAQPSSLQQTTNPTAAPNSSPSTNACSEAANLSGKIEAEDYCDSLGVGEEATSDVGGGTNVGWIDPGDYLAFPIQVEVEATYKVQYRYASPDGDGSLRLELEDGSFLGAIDSLPATGDWQNWQTVSHLVVIPAGSHTLIVKATAPGWNLNWLELTIPQPTTMPSAMPSPQPSFGPTPAPSSSAGPTPFPSMSSAPTEPQPTPSPNSIPTDYGGFLRAEGKSIVTEQDETIILRGMGFGGWMVKEPYMLLAEGIAQGGQSAFLREVEKLTGTDNKETYHKAWLDNYCTEADVMELARSGFNSLRVPLHYNLFTLPIEEEPVRGQDTWLSDGFERLDRLLEWCENANIYLILDLHAAPGGQGYNSGISDYDSSKPSLWEDPENVRKTIALWEQLAIRYSDKGHIGGYDLVNEVNWAFEGGNPVGCDDVVNAPLKDLYDRAIAAIRAVDTKHIIFIEGNCYANNHNGLWPFDDDNLVLSFHRYWDLNSIDTIQKYLDWRDEYNVPLWMGESGENTNWWYRDAVQLLESNDIGWAWWTWKKMTPNAGFSDTSGSSSFSIIKPDNYQTLLDYWSNPYANPKPDSDFAFTTMMEVANNVLLENTVRNDGAIDALTAHVLRPCDGVTQLPDTSESVRVEAEYYCEVDGFLTDPTDDVGGGANVGFTDAGDWLTYKVNVSVGGTYKVDYRYTSPDGNGSLRLGIEDGPNDGSVLGSIDSFPITGDWQNWATTSHEVVLPAGQYKLVIEATAAGWNLNWFELSRK